MEPAPRLASMIMTKIEQKETLFLFVPWPSESRLKARSSLPFHDTEKDTCLSLNIRCSFLQLSVRLNSVVKGFGSLRLLKTVWKGYSCPWLSFAFWLYHYLKQLYFPCRMNSQVSSFRIVDNSLQYKHTEYTYLPNILFMYFVYLLNIYLNAHERE